MPDSAGSIPVLSRRTSDNTVEGLREVAGAFKSAAAADFQDRKIGFPEQDAGAGDPVVDQILDGREMQHSFKAAQTLSFTDVGMRCQLGNGDRPGIIFLQV